MAHFCLIVTRIHLSPPDVACAVYYNNHKLNAPVGIPDGQSLSSAERSVTPPDAVFSLVIIELT